MNSLINQKGTIFLKAIPVEMRCRCNLDIALVSRGFDAMPLPYKYLEKTFTQFQCWVFTVMVWCFDVSPLIMN